MEAPSPISVGAEVDGSLRAGDRGRDRNGEALGHGLAKPCHIPTKKLELARRHAPPLSIPLRFMLTGLVTLWVGAAWFLFRPDLLVEYHYGPQIIALTHLIAIGFVGSVVMGVVYQMFPVVLGSIVEGGNEVGGGAGGVRLYSEKLARRHYWFHTIGFVGMVAMFWIWNIKQVGHFGSVFATGVGIFAWNIWKTYKPHRVRHPVVFGVLSSVTWLVSAVLAGLYLASAKSWPRISFFNPLSQLHGHAHLALLGAFVILLVGASYRMLPMFLLSEIQSVKRAWVSLILLDVGLVGLVPAMTLSLEWKCLFAWVICAGLGCFAMEARAIFGARKRRQLDLGLKVFLGALCMLGIVACFGVILSWPGRAPTEFLVQLENVYGYLAVFGVLTPAIQAILLKVMPFLVWTRAYGHQVGIRPTPTLAEMGSRQLQFGFAVCYVTGVLAAGLGIALKMSGVVQGAWLLVVVAQICYAANVVKILRHLGSGGAGEVESA